MRINPQSLPLQEKSGGNFDLLYRLQTLKVAGAAGEWMASGGIHYRSVNTGGDDPGVVSGQMANRVDF